MNQSKQIDLDSLTGQEFTQLAHDIILNLQNQKETKLYSDTASTHDLGYDFYGEYFLEDDIQRVFAVIVKQAKTVAPSYVLDVLQRISRLHKRPDELLFFTTAIIDLKAMGITFKNIEGLIDLEIWDRVRLEEYLSQNLGIYKKYFKIASNRKKKLNIQIYSSLIGAIASILASLLSTTIFFSHDKTNLPEQITEVEVAITNLKSLESTLETVKTDLIKTQIESEQIKKEYEEAQKLKQITTEQLEIINSVITKRSFGGRLIDWIIGLVLGISTSVLGNYIYGWRKKQRNLV